MNEDDLLTQQFDRDDRFKQPSKNDEKKSQKEITLLIQNSLEFMVNLINPLSKYT